MSIDDDDGEEGVLLSARSIEVNNSSTIMPFEDEFKSIDVNSSCRVDIMVEVSLVEAKIDSRNRSHAYNCCNIEII